LGQYVVLPKSFIAFYGIESVLFVALVRIGDTIHREARIKSLTETDAKRGIIEWESLIKNQRERQYLLIPQKFLPVVGYEGTTRLWL